MKNKPCPFCGANLIQENLLCPLAKKYGEFKTFYVHPENGCVLEALALNEEQLKKWNKGMSK